MKLTHSDRVFRIAHLSRSILSDYWLIALSYLITITLRLPCTFLVKLLPRDVAAASETWCLSYRVDRLSERLTSGWHFLTHPSQTPSLLQSDSCLCMDRSQAPCSFVLQLFGTISELVTQRCHHWDITITVVYLVKQISSPLFILKVIHL